MEKNNNIHILVGTPCYGGLIHQDYVQALIEYNNLKLPMTFMHIGNESLITRARNTIISYFYANRNNFSHLLFLDADVYLSGNDLIKLISHEKDVIGAAVPMKGFNNDGTPIYNFNDVLDSNIKNNPELIEVKRVGTAVYLLSRKAVEDLVKVAKNNNDVYHGSNLTRGTKQNNIDHFDVFKVGVVDDNYLSEDFYVCNKLRELGYKIYIDKTIRTRHSGTFTFQG